MSYAQVQSFYVKKPGKLLTLLLSTDNIPVALNKKSAQKQKRICNNGFSQAVVPRKRNKGLKNLLQTKFKTSPKQPLQISRVVLLFVVTYERKGTECFGRWERPVRYY